MGVLPKKKARLPNFEILSYPPPPRKKAKTTQLNLRVFGDSFLFFWGGVAIECWTEISSQTWGEWVQLLFAHLRKGWAPLRSFLPEPRGGMHGETGHDWAEVCLFLGVMGLG